MRAGNKHLESPLHQNLLQALPWLCFKNLPFSVLRIRIIEWIGLEGTFKDHLVQSPFHGQGHLPLDQVAQSPIQPALEHVREGAATASPGNLFQCFTTLTVQNFFLMSNLNLSSCSLKPLPLMLSLQALVKSLYLSYKPPLSTERSPWSLLQAEQPQLSQPFLTAEVFHPSHHFCGPPLDPP